METKCNCEICKKYAQYKKMTKKELIEVIFEQEFDLQFLEMYKDLCFKFLEKANISFKRGTTAACCEAYQFLNEEPNA